MKKVLIASTALVAAGLMTAGTASASEKIKLNLGGYSKWWVVGAWNNDDFNKATGAQPVNVDVKGDNEVYFGGSTTLDNGLKVGIDIQLEAGGHTDSRAVANANSNLSTDVIDESYVFVEGGFGKLIVGSKNNGTYLIHNTAPDAAGNWNEGGIMTGDFAIARATGVTRMGQIAADVTSGAATRTYTAGDGNTTAILTDGDSEGLTYVSPTFYGLTVGASYKPNGLSEDARGVENQTGAAGLGPMPVYGAGVLYANTFGGVGVKADFGYAQYDPRHAVKGAGATTIHGVQREYSTGAQVSYAGFTLGGSYRQIIDNKLAPSGGATVLNTSDYNGKAWDLGLQYASGPYAVSFAYFQSKTAGTIGQAGVAGSENDDKIEFYQLSGKYTLGAGVDVLASGGYAKSEDEAGKGTGAGENKGWVVMTGLSLAF